MHHYLQLQHHLGYSSVAIIINFVVGSDVVNPVKKDERRIYCTGKVDFNGNECEDAMFDSPARLVYAIATNNSGMENSIHSIVIL